jgi:peptide/nickel transport system substrate-binding protein
MALRLARPAFIGILAEAQGAVPILPPPDGVWGMPPEVLHSLPGYGPDVASNRTTEARGIMKRLGYPLTSGSRSRCRPAMSPAIAIRR